MSDAEKPDVPTRTLRISPDRSVEEVDQDGTRVAQPPVDPLSPDSYLLEATRMLGSCASAPALYAAWRRPDGSTVSAGLAYQAAPARRTEFARNSLLFAALACEAYINRYLDEALGAASSDAVERRPTIEKYVDVPRELDLPVRFHRGQQPGQGLAKLMRTRNHLVHPRRTAAEPTLGPVEAAAGIVAVARAALVLRVASGSGEAIAMVVVKQASAVQRYALEAASGLPDVDADAPPDLFTALLNLQLGPDLQRAMVSRHRSPPPAPQGTD